MFSITSAAPDSIGSKMMMVDCDTCSLEKYMVAIRGIVQGNVVILPEDANLPDGATVEVLVSLPNSKDADDQGVPDQIRPSNQHPKPRSLGAGASGYTNTARRTGEEHPEPRTWR